MVGKLRKVVILAALVGCSWPALADHWALSGDVGVHDPSIIKENSTYWTFSTGAGIQVLYSDSTGKKWTRGTQLFNSVPGWWKSYVPDHSGLDVWAPDVQKFNGKIWVYYAISTFGSNTSAIGLLSASSVAKGDWVDQGLVIRSKAGSNDYNAIDPNLTVDADGTPWLVFGSWFSGIKIVKIDKTTMKPTGSLTSLAKRSGGIEGPTIIYKSGYYYLFASVGKCCAGINSTYKIIVGRSKTITGPYVDQDGTKLLSGGGTVFDAGNARWVGPGGQDINGTGLIVRHAYDANDNGNPKMLISDLSWSGGWPTY